MAYQPVERDPLATFPAYGAGLPVIGIPRYHTEAWRARQTITPLHSLEAQVWNALGQSKWVNSLGPGVGISFSSEQPDVADVVCIVAYAKDRDGLTYSEGKNYTVNNLLDTVGQELSAKVKGLPNLALTKPAALDVKEGVFEAPYLSYHEVMPVRVDSNSLRRSRHMQETRLYVVENAEQARSLYEQLAEPQLTLQGAVSARVVRKALQGDSLSRPSFPYMSGGHGR
ncbi:MAG: hypothetical protein KGJ07_05230 [Patescibacteria group bacterium]|nr:hypothetical protein [Patescibacteria group bacterium]